MAARNNLRQNLATAERSALYDIYKDHIGEMVTGTVEKADDRSVSVNIGRTTVELGRREMIGDEYFKVGDPIKVYIQEVKSAVPEEGKAPRGPQIEVTRSSEGFLKRLFEEEIHGLEVLFGFGVAFIEGFEQFFGGITLGEAIGGASGGQHRQFFFSRHIGEVAFRGQNEGTNEGDFRFLKEHLRLKGSHPSAMTLKSRVVPLRRISVRVSPTWTTPRFTVPMPIRPTKSL